MIDGGELFFDKEFYFFKNFLYRNILFSEKRLLCGLPNLAVDAIVGTDLVRNEIDSKGSSQPS